MTQVSRFAFLLLVLSACKGSSPTTTVSITLAPSTATADIGGTQQFQATVSGAPSGAQITWSLSGPGCANDGCGWIDAAGNYIAPDDPPNPPTVTVTATISGDEPKSATATVTITTHSNAGFSGKYAVLFNGFEANNVGVAITGSIEVDGNGGVTGGTLDSNRTAGYQLVTIINGTYSFGADNRGRLNLNTSQGALAFRFAMNAPNPPNHTGRLICFQPGDASRITGAVVIKKQNPAAFAASAFNGDFAAGFLGELGPRTPYNVIGRFTLDAATGVISNGLLDINLAGAAYASVPSTGTYSAISSTSGRGTAQLGFPAPFGNLNFTFYVVTAGEAFFLSTDVRGDTNPLLSGPMLKQADRPFTASSLTGSLAFNTTGLTSFGGSDVTIGRFDAATGTASGIFDNNDAGLINANTAFTGSYDVANSGRGTLAVQTGGTTINYVLYMVSRNTALLMQSQALEAGWGSIEAQTGPFTTASISGNYVVGTVTPAECGCTSTSGVVSLNGASGTFLGARDKSEPVGLFPRDVWSGTFAITAGTNGRGTLTATNPSPELSAIYVVSPNKLLLINVETDFNLSTVTILEK
jgi:hypothetical protein